MFVTYDSEADALYVRLADPDVEVAETDEVVDARIMVDYDAAGGVIGVEILGATRSLDLTGVPEADKVAEAIRSLRHLATV